MMSREKRNNIILLLVSILGASVIALVFQLWRIRDRRPSESFADVTYDTPRPMPTMSPPPIYKEPEPPPEPTTWREAFARHRPLMVEGTERSTGSILFAAWSLNRLQWADVHVATNETTIAKVRKDPDAERGKRLCAGVTIIQITADKTDIATGYYGTALTGATNVLYFYAVGSTGELVERSHGRLCGMVMGNVAYSNVSGGTTHAVDVVGMFDLPENRAAK